MSTFLAIVAIGLLVFLALMAFALKPYLLPHIYIQKRLFETYWEPVREHPGRLVYSGGVRHTVWFWTEGRIVQFNDVLQTFN